MKVIFLMLASCALSFAATKQVGFDMDKEKFPFPSTFLVDDFVLYDNPQYYISQLGSNLPAGPQYGKISQLFELLKKNNIAAAKLFFVDPSNENVERGLAFIAKQEVISLVASWREKDHYVVMVTNQSGMEKLLFPMVIQESKDLKIETNALFLGNFIGAIGNCIAQGMVSSIHVSEPILEKSDPDKFSASRIRRWMPALAIVTLSILAGWYRFFRGKDHSK